MTEGRARIGKRKGEDKENKKERGGKEKRKGKGGEEETTRGRRTKERVECFHVE